MRTLILAAYCIAIGTGYWLKYLNLSYLRIHGRSVPPGFEGIIDPDLLKKISDYTYENTRAGLLESLIGNLVLVGFLFCGVLGAYDHWIASLAHSFLLNGIFFFLVLVFAETLMNIPFSLYRNFGIEKRYGFNTMTV
ncbi:MAG TPA: M48 family peptidase, partial [Nitrospirota bacterium]